MSDRVYRLGRGPWPLNFFGFAFAVSQAARSPRFQPNNGVLRQGHEVAHMFMMFSPLPMGMEREDRCE